ncbi:hypothetical protein TVAG_274670 [Trichomonas vaginalis G3]|uniref:Uncharacterized protein n=1 Tax=Trichomonas vaginalis (strain ATCC PRA-98 / G3) TaxID=412133 RepID=A2EB58_TRIV3|nr:hypothetical protein TVAGG3_0354330 [Trichomonas vaginalis G3]EAY10104.1 hypothetical protein TVAG_274670 [Trichomonas vaginalis G3]KAI5531521.1 hypothetical protein TVAGG3_0354330 [Trichomonas vaginalis G3]|eukprot:XP_001322327.1 hypothetical protein [Trichomonas vaginalis G3]
MKKGAKIKRLKKQRREANEQLDFERAQMIDEEIKKYYIKKYRPDFSDVIRIQRQKDKIKLKSIGESSRLEEESKAIQLHYRDLLNELKERQLQEIQQLKEERKQTLKREKDRPIPLARERLKKAILIGKTGDYELAKKIREEAISITEQELPIRLEACKETYRRLEEKMNRRHNREVCSLLQKMLNDSQQVSMKSLKRQNQLLASMRNQTIKEQESYWKATKGFRYIPTY